MDKGTHPIIKTVKLTSFSADIDLGLPEAGRKSAQYPRRFIAIGGDVAFQQSDGTSITYEAAALVNPLPHCGMVKILSTGTSASAVYAEY